MRATDTAEATPHMNKTTPHKTTPHDTTRGAETVQDMDEVRHRIDAHMTRLIACCHAHVVTEQYIAPEVIRGEYYEACDMVGAEGDTAQHVTSVQCVTMRCDV